MTRISTFCVVTSALAALALSVSSAGAFKMKSPKVIVPTPKVTVKMPTNQPKGHFALDGYNPKAIKGSGGGTGK